MSETMGLIIRRLRKERNLTQEELAEMLNVSNQAISKWERDESMPDISQIVPLASVFGVTTDVLFGMDGADVSEEAYRIVQEANTMQRYGHTAAYLDAYDRMMDGLKRYPNNLILLNNCAGLGLALCLPENGWIYAPERAAEIAAETERQAKLILTYSKNPSDLMRAHQILVFLFSSRRDFDKALSETSSFPVRADFTFHNHRAFVAEAMGDYIKSIDHLENDNHDHLVALADNILLLGRNYAALKQYAKAVEVYECWFKLIGSVCEGRFPPYHDSDFGDCYLHLAAAYIGTGDYGKAMENVENSVNYWLENCSPDGNSQVRCSPILIEDWWDGISRDVLKFKLTDKLASPELDPLRGSERFRALENKVNSL